MFTIRSRVCVAAAVVGILATSPALAEPEISDVERAAQERDDALASLDARQVTAIRQQKEVDAAEDFKGLGLGAGLAVTFGSGTDRISEAEVVAGLVRVKKSENIKPRVMLESHYFFLPKRKLFGLEHKMWGIGPFVALQPGTGDVIDAAALGLMMGFRRKPEQPASFNLGAGFLIDRSVQVLGDGIVANQPLPAGETTVRFKQSDQKGFLILASFSF